MFTRYSFFVPFFCTVDFSIAGKTFHQMQYALSPLQSTVQLQQHHVALCASCAWQEVFVEIFAKFNPNSFYLHIHTASGGGWKKSTLNVANIE